MDTQQAMPTLFQPPLSVTLVKTSLALFFGHMTQIGMMVTRNQQMWQTSEAVSKAGSTGAHQVLKNIVMIMMARAINVYFQLAKTKSKL